MTKQFQVLAYFSISLVCAASDAFCEFKEPSFGITLWTPCARVLARVNAPKIQIPLLIDSEKLTRLWSDENHPQYSVTYLEPGYYAESVGRSRAFGELKIKYFSPQRRQRFRVFVEGGRLYDAYGVLLCVRKSCNGIYGMTGWGQIYFHDNPQDGVIHHSSLFGGGPLASAGSMRIYRGRIMEISNRSGHYKIPWNKNGQIFKELCRFGYHVNP